VLRFGKFTDWLVVSVCVVVMTIYLDRTTRLRMECQEAVHQFQHRERRIYLEYFLGIPPSPEARQHAAAVSQGMWDWREMMRRLTFLEQLFISFWNLETNKFHS